MSDAKQREGIEFPAAACGRTLISRKMKNSQNGIGVGVAKQTPSRGAG